MNTSRTPFDASALPVDLAALKVACRVDHAEDDARLATMARAAAAEIEGYGEVALLGQTVVAEWAAWECEIPLPIGPFLAEALPEHPATVQLRDADGALSPHPSGWWIRPGLRPVLHLTAPGEGSGIVVTYPAGFGATASSLPAEITIAIQDAVSRAYDLGSEDDASCVLSVQTARVVHRLRGVRL